MNIRAEKWGFSFHFSLTRMSRQLGINSKLKDGNHMLLWDFDDVDYKDVYTELKWLQRQYWLPTIYVVGTGVARYYHAYCFCRCSWERTRGIIGETKGVDKVFLAMGCLRGYFTLRISKKAGREFEPLDKIESGMPEECLPEEAATISRYWTKRG